MCLCNNLTPTQKIRTLAQSIDFGTTHLLEFNLATPNAYQMIALRLCNNITYSQTQTPLNLRETPRFERQG